VSNVITTTSVGTTCGQAIELVEGRVLRELLRIHRPVILAALDEAAAERVERTQSSCTDCVHSAEERCEDHRADLERAAEYRRTSDALAAALEA
jgi:bacterioferritin-associated ferredoxin